MINLGNPARPTSRIGSVSTQNLNERIKEVENYIDDATTSNFASATLSATSTVTVGGALIMAPAFLSNAGGAGVVSPTSSVTALTTTGAGTLTLANGTAGQVIYIIHEVDGGSAVLTPATKTGYTTITFTVVGDSATLVYLATRGWMITSLRGAVAA